jgi:membrane carboxypeptidase/penicillin-binding protein
MRLLMRALAIGLGILVLATCFGIFWIFVYSRDLPDMNALAQFAPAQGRQVSDPCIATASVAIPYEAIGNKLRAALRAAGAGEEDPGVINEVYRGLSDQAKPHEGALSVQISGSMLCAPSMTLRRAVNELRTAAQLERRFSRKELFTIFANRVWFGEGQVGVEAAAQHFFQKKPDQLQVGEAALLAGLIRGPSRLSPYSHPERALQRRNKVIDAMVEAHAIDPKEGETAKASALGVVRTDVP